MEQRFLSRFGMSEYYGSEGFDRAPSDVYSTRTGMATSAMTGLGRERLSPWYDVGYVFVCVCVCSLEWVPRV